MQHHFHRDCIDSHEYTIAGLLTKRSDLTAEAVTIRDRFVAIKNDWDAIDRVLKALGYEGYVDATMAARSVSSFLS